LLLRDRHNDDDPEDDQNGGGDEDLFHDPADLTAPRMTAQMTHRTQGVKTMMAAAPKLFLKTRASPSAAMTTIKSRNKSSSMKCAPMAPSFMFIRRPRLDGTTSSTDVASGVLTTETIPHARPPTLA